MENPSVKLDTENGKFIAYKYIKANSPKDYLVFFIHGYADNMKEEKAMKMEEICKKLDIDLVKLDLYGRGESSGKLRDMTMDEWYNCCKTIIEKIILPTNKKIILSGSSLGGWLSYIFAEELKDKVIGVISAAGAVDFFTGVIEPLIKEEDKDKEFVYEMIYNDGLPSGDFISRKLIESTRKYNMLHRDKINIKCPIRIIHGLIDELVPYEYSLNFSKKVESQDLKLYMVKKMDHDFTLKNNLDVLEKVVQEFINDLN